MPCDLVVLAPAFHGGREPLAVTTFRWVRVATSEAAAIEALRAAEAAASDGAYALIALAYELAAAFEPRLTFLRGRPASWPLAIVAAFEGNDLVPAASAGRVAAPFALAPDTSDAAFAGAIRRVLAYLAAGDAYQVNLTRRLHGRTDGAGERLFHALLDHQPAPYAAYLRLSGHEALSLSPELFYERQGDLVRTRPMKGTARRARTLPEDLRAGEALVRDQKNRAENLMIVDLMRNDLSRVCRAGTVRVPALFSLETYRTFHALTSTIEGRLAPGIDLVDVLAALFPCGSVTGAPKIRAMEIIDELEGAPRGLYTGAIGVLRPGGDAVFNVAIRTLTITNGRAQMGVGGGIVADSTPQDEIEETRLKARFLSTLPARAEDQGPLELIETMRAEGGRIPRLERHLARLGASARYFGLPFDAGRAMAAAKAAAQGGTLLRLRLTLRADGEIACAASPLAAAPFRTARIVDERIASDDPYRAHKTNRRAIYDEAAARFSKTGHADEPLFLNERGELAEGARTNVFLRREGRLLTPPIESGALPGILRAELLEAGEAEERALWPDDLAMGELLLGNALRGLMPVRFLA